MSRWDAALCPLCAAAWEAPTPRCTLGSVPPSQGGSLFPGCPGSPGRSGEREGRPLKSLCFGAGSYLAQQLVGLYGLSLKVAGRLKIEAFRLGRERCCSVSPATPGSAPVHPLQLAVGAGARPHPPWAPGLQHSLAPSPPAQSALGLGWSGGDETSTWDPAEGDGVVLVPTRSSTSDLACWGSGIPTPGPAVGPGPPQLAQA